MLVATLASIAPARAASPSYTLIGYASQPSNGTPPVPAGVQVDLVSRATGAVYTTTIVGGSGQFKFTSAGTTGALAPGYWGVWIPAQTNISLSGKPYAILPQNQSPTWVFENATSLTSVSYPVDLYGVLAVPYVGELKGTVYSGGQGVSGAGVSLLAASYNNVVLENNTTNSSGYFTLKAPIGTWVLESTLPGSTTYYNLTSVTVTSRTPKVVDTNISTYVISGYSKINTPPNYPKVPNAGNATLFDPLNGYIYSTPTAPGGFYSLGTYAKNFTGGTQPFDVILSNIGYRTTWFPINISGGAPIYHNVYVSPQTSATLGVYLTTLNFSAVNVTSGSGNVTVNTIANLGNDTVFGTMPNGSVGQLWGQLGLDLAHSTLFPAADLGLVYAQMNASGPFFPIAQAQLTVNGTGFANPTAPSSLSSWGSTCGTSCGLNSSANITLGWTGKYALNGTIPKNSSLYTISFNFRHPSSAEVYNYSVDLPAGYVLAAGTSAPTKTTLVPNGPDNTWTKFTLTSLPGPSGVSTAKFNIVKSANLTANVNVSVSSFTFSSANVLNSTHAGYTVIVGVNQNVTFSALNSTYPAGTNGTKFVWNFGDGSNPVTTTTPTTNHTYKVASGANPDVGSVTITASGGQVNSTSFKVWVASGPVTAGLQVNATAAQTRNANGVTYYQVNWSTVLSLNATGSTAKISPSTPTPQNVISVALITTAGRGFKSITIQNLSRSAGVNPLKNVSYQFLGAGAYIQNTTINGVPIVFKGWQYNVTLRVWAGSGQSASTTVIFLVVDTQKPSPAFTILNAAGTKVGGSGVQVGTNLTAKIQLNASNSTDPNNGSISKYSWKISNSGNSTFKNITWNQTTVRPLPTYWLGPQSKAYTVNLTVWDLNGNTQYTTQSLQVSTNSTYNVIMAANNLTAPSSYTQGTTYTLWVNVTVGGGSKATAQNVTVAWYLLSASGTGSKSYLGGSPGSVKFYYYTGGVVNATSFATGKVPSLAFNKTVRAEITWTPGSSGNYLLYANATASNEWAGDIPNGPGIVSQSISVSPNSTTQYLEYAAIAAGVVVVILIIYFLYRRGRSRPGTPKSGSSGKGGLERGTKKPADEDDDEES